MRRSLWQLRRCFPSYLDKRPKRSVKSGEDIGAAAIGWRKVAPPVVMSKKSSQRSWNWMSNYDPGFQKRKDTAAAAKNALLQKFKAAAEDPKIAQRQAERMAINEARVVRRAERKAARLKRETELAEEVVSAAEREALAQLEAKTAATLLAAEQVEREAAIVAEKKAERDARYAARKADKKLRRHNH